MDESSKWVIHSSLECSSAPWNIRVSSKVLGSEYFESRQIISGITLFRLLNLQARVEAAARARSVNFSEDTLLPIFRSLDLGYDQSQHNTKTPPSRWPRGSPPTRRRSSFPSRTHLPMGNPTRQYALAAATNILILSSGELFAFLLTIPFAVFRRATDASQFMSLIVMLRSFLNPSREGRSYLYIVHSPPPKVTP